MNLNELNIIKSINVETPVADVETGTGTFKDILDKVYSNEIVPLTINDGTIVGISYDAKASNIVEDNIAQMKFEKLYTGRPIMEWVLKALELKARRVEVREVVEDGDDVKVITKTGEEIVITEGYSYDENYDYDDWDEEDELPDYEEIPYDELDPDVDLELAVRNYLRNKYNHYLAKGCVLDIDDCDDEYVVVSNIEWGRKR